MPDTVARRRDGVRAFLAEHPLVSYYVLAFVISWGAVFVVVGPGEFLSLTGTSPLFAAAGFASLLGPGLAGVLLTTLVDGSAGWRNLLLRLRRWRVGVRWYAVALLTAPVVMGLTLFAMSLTSPGLVPVIFTAGDKATLVLSAIAAALIVPIFEELGWTGFAMPRFRRRHGILATGVMMGLLWGAWHFPLFAGNAAASGGIPATVMMAALLFAWLVPYRVLMVWIYDRTRSLLVTMLMHMPIVVGQILLGVEAISAEEMFTSVMVTGAAYWVVVGGAALANRDRGQLTTLPGVSVT